MTDTIPYVRVRRAAHDAPDAQVELRPLDGAVRLRVRIGRDQHEARLPVEACRALRERLAAASIPIGPLAAPAAPTSVGNGFELQIGSLPSCVMVSWVNQPPPGWESCVEILRAVLELADGVRAESAAPPSTHRL
jgi:hypothetical protein